MQNSKCEPTKEKYVMKMRKNAIIKDGEMCIIIFIRPNVLQRADTSFEYHIKSLSVLPHAHTCIHAYDSHECKHVRYKLAYLRIFDTLTHKHKHT